MKRYIIIGMAALVTGAQGSLFFDDFDAGTSSTRWDSFNSNTDFVIDFARNYATLGIPSAPNSTGGSTVGLFISVNDTLAATSAVSLFARGSNYTGNVVMTFDMWLNFTGTVGTTEFATFGVAQPGGGMVWHTSAPADSVWFAVSGDGGAAFDYRAYRGTTMFADASGVYAAGTTNFPRDHGNPYYRALFPSPPAPVAGIPGMQWVRGRVETTGTQHRWFLNDTLIATVNDGRNSGLAMLGYMDVFASVSGPSMFVVYDNVEVVPEPATMLVLGAGAAALMARRRRRR